MTFQLDTSGEVLLTIAKGMPAEVAGGYRWPDLTPFVQGYVEALLGDVRYQRDSAGVRKGDHIVKWDERVNYTNSRLLAFRDLAPATLAAILEDCKDLVRFGVYRMDEGAEFWEERQTGAFRFYPPLTPTLSDDGKVVFA